MSEFYGLRWTSRRTVKLNLESSSCSDDVQKFLSVLDTEGFPELELLWRIRHLQKLHLESSSYKEIFSYEEDETHVGIDTELDIILQQLGSLTVRSCENLMTSSTEK
ncbi:hypothetical protein Q3G72_001861 [Acer saccharum]|nr:hypothetical protein Q3G72_001861 [Acer saccharum]